MSKVCVIAPDHAVALEERGVVPDCRYHQHLSHREADVMVAAAPDSKTRMLIEGWGRARSVRSIDGKRRITPISQVLTYASRPSGFRLDRFVAACMGVSSGPSTLQAVMSEFN